MSERAQALVEQLRDFRTRKQAMDQLLMLGNEAIPELLDALAHPMENVRWCARSTLCQLGGDEVVARLIDTLDDATRQEQAAEALRGITGQSIGLDRQAWTHWLRARGQAAAPAEPTPAPSPAVARAPEPTREPAPPGPAAAEAAPPPAEHKPPEPLSDDELIQAAIEGAAVDVRQHAGGYVLTVPLETGRRQRVTVSFAGHDFEGEPLVVVYTECGPANPKLFEWALRQNLRMSFGAIAVRDRGGQPTFVMVDTHPRGTLDVEELRKSILLLARKGDKLEAALTHADER